jgi:hypothetical protein
MNRRFGGDASLNMPIRDDRDSGEWQAPLVDDTPSPERVLVETEDFDIRAQGAGRAWQRSTTELMLTRSGCAASGIIAPSCAA